MVNTGFIMLRFKYFMQKRPAGFCPYGDGIRALRAVRTGVNRCTWLCVAFFAIPCREHPLSRLVEHDTLFFECLVKLFCRPHVQLFRHLAEHKYLQWYKILL